MTCDVCGCEFSSRVYVETCGECQAFDRGRTAGRAEARADEQDARQCVLMKVGSSVRAICQAHVSETRAD